MKKLVLIIAIAMLITSCGTKKIANGYRLGQEFSPNYYVVVRENNAGGQEFAGFADIPNKEGLVDWFVELPISGIPAPNEVIVGPNGDIFFFCSKGFGWEVTWVSSDPMNYKVAKMGFGREIEPIVSSIEQPVWSGKPLFIPADDLLKPNFRWENYPGWEYLSGR